MGDAAGAARAGQQTPNGYYNLERRLKGIVTSSTLDELTELTAAAEKVLVFRAEQASGGLGWRAP